MNSTVRFSLGACAVLAVMLLPHVSLAQGCAMCSTVGNGANDPLVKGMFRSIVFMVSMPFVLVATAGGWLAYHLRREPSGVPESGVVPIARIIDFRRS